MAAVIKFNETRTIKDCHYIQGLSLERGCYQLKDPTYRAYSMDVLGYVAPRTEINEKYIVTMKSEEWLKKGQTVQRILLMWNAGEGASKCSSGINRHNVKYDSCAYVNQGLVAYNQVAEQYDKTN